MSRTKENLSLDSAYFVAFEMTHDALKRGVKNKSSLSITQYRMLVKLVITPEGIAQSDIARIMGLKANVVTQAANALEQAGFARREADGADARSKRLFATDQGTDHVAAVNDSIIDQLYTLFPTEDDSWRAMLEASIAAGSQIDPPSSDEELPYQASRALASLERFRIAVETGLKNACGAAYSDCRIMQRLGETARPMRIGEIAIQLQLSPVNVARAVDRLADRGWVQRMGAEQDRKAVYVEMTDLGTSQQQTIVRTVDELGSELLWKRLTRTQRDAMRNVTETVIEGLRRKEEEKQLIDRGSLRPIER